MATVLITGGTGMIGKALAKALLEKGYHVIILSRSGNKREEATNLSYAQWNVHGQTIDKDAVICSDYIIHLAGASVADKRWTKKRKQEIVDSRVKSVELLVKTLKENPNQVKAVFSSSGIGWYGPDPVVPNPNPFTEEDPSSGDFLGTTCKLWESSIATAAQLGKRVAIFRTGIVLKSGDGPMKEFERPLRFGIAAILGNGKQIVSWIHIDDLVRLYITAIENENINGVYNAVAPAPVSNKDFTIQLAKTKRGKFYIPIYVPSFVLKIVLGEMSIEALKSATVSCNKLLYAGFDFSFPTIAAALESFDK